MKKRFQIKSFIIATFFLAAYLNVFATQASCNLSHLFEQTTKSTHQHEGGHDHHHGNGEEVPPHHHNDKPDHHHDGKSGKKDNGCCNDKTSAFFAGQGNPATTSVDFKNTYTEFALINPVFFVCNRPVFNTKGHITYSLPPPKIPDIRVFIQSFLI